jgi:CBS domain-containing protein
LIQIKALVLACLLNSESNWNYPNTAQASREDFMLEQAKIVASDIMTRDVAVVHPDTTLLDALKVMASRRISGLPVVDDQARWWE